jgi:hypothetical protein
LELRALTSLAELNEEDALEDLRAVYSGFSEGLDTLDVRTARKHAQR